MYQYRIWNSDFKGGLGLALSHPLYHLIGIAVKHLPLGEFGQRINILSSIFGAVTVANTFLFVKLWTKKLSPAILAALSLALGWTFWHYSVIAEVYTLYTAIFTLELVCLLLFFSEGKISWIYLLGFLNGLSISNHLWGLIPLFCYIYLLLFLAVKKKIAARQLTFFVVSVAAGSSLYILLIVNEYIKTGQLTEVLASALFGNSWSDAVMNVSMTSKMLLENLLFILYNFATPNLLFVVFGIFALYKYGLDIKMAVVLTAVALLFLAFAFRYTVPDRYSFFLPFYCIVSILIGIGFGIFLTKYQNRNVIIAALFFAIIPVPVYFIAPEIAEARNVNLGTNRTIPYRDDYDYFLKPWKLNCNGPEKFAKTAFGTLNSGDIIIADGTTVYPLWYRKNIQNPETDVEVISLHGSYQNPFLFPGEEEVNELVSQGRLYVVTPVKGYCPMFILQNYDFEKEKIIYKIIE